MQTKRLIGTALPSVPRTDQDGFTLIELAIVMFVVALLLGGMLLPLSAQQDVRNFADTQKILVNARDALLGFAMANDRLPCPATAASNGQEDPVGGGACTAPYSGFFPAATVGLSPVDSQGYLVDGWGGEPDNRVRYAVSSSNSNAFSTLSGMKSTGMTTLATTASGDLKVCSTGVGMSGEGTVAADCAANTSLAVDAVAVVYSLGKNAGNSGSGTEESHNPNPQSAVTADPAFVSPPQGPTFDDQVTWLSKSVLFNRLVTAGRLP